MAVTATRASRLEFGGVDVLEAPDGRLHVLESNFPYYFGQAQVVAGIDMAGAMVEHLMAKALTARSASAREPAGTGTGYD